MTRLKVQTHKKLRSDAAWLECLLRQAGVPVCPDTALVQVTVSEPIVTAAVNDPAFTSPKLRARAEQIVRRAQARNLPIFPVAVAPLFSGWRLHTKGQHYDYIFCNLAEDPLLRDPDGFPIPQPVLRHLRRLHEAGLGQEFDMLYVIHEVEKGKIREGEPLDPDKLVPPSPRVQQASRLFGTLSMGLWLGTAVPLLAGTGLGVVTAAMAMVPLGLDPLLLGAIVAAGRPVAAGEPAVWFYLAHWQYADEEASL